MIEINLKLDTAADLQNALEAIRPAALPRVELVSSNVEVANTTRNVELVRELLDGARNPIQAIKAIRALTGLGVKEAKDLFEEGRI